ncbi:MAG: cbb3-type cytochrome c oxidase subunit I [Actinomycetota bacterium]
MPPKKQAVRPPSLRDVMRARQAEMKVRVEKVREQFIEPILSRFPGMLPTKPDSAAKYAIVSSTVWFIVGLLLALLLAIKLVVPEFLDQWAWMSYGRLAAAETAVMTWGVLFTGFVGAMFAVVPRLTGTKLWSERIGAQTVILHDNVVLAGLVLLLLGRTQGISGLELPWPIDLAILNVLLMLAQNVVATVARRTVKPMSVPIWYYLAAIIVLPTTYAFGNLAAPWYYGVDQQIVAGFAVAGIGAGLVLMGVGTAYYVLPRATGLPIYSDRVATMGFWSFVFAAPWVGQAWAILGPAPDHLETVAITFAGWLVIPALCVFVNLWGTMRDAWDKLHSEPAATYVLGGTAFLLFGSIHLAAGSLRTVQNVVGETTWQLGTQTAIAGGLGLILVGLVYHLFPRIIGRSLHSVPLAAKQFWVTTFGLATVVAAMSVAGVVQGYLQIAGVQTETPNTTGAGWFVITLATRPLFVLRIAGGGLVVAGLFMFLRNLVSTVTSGADAPVEAPAEVVAEPVGASA